MPVTSEHDIAQAVMIIAARQRTGRATFRRIYNELPAEIRLTADDLAGSITRNGEPMWHQIVRNIQSHHVTEGNAIAEGWLTHIPRIGYEITDAGRRRIR